MHFAEGEYRDSAGGTEQYYVHRGQATLPADIQERITRERKAGDPDAAVDPMYDPAVRAALQRTSIELLVGFNLTEDPLQLNVLRLFHLSAAHFFVAIHAMQMLCQTARVRCRERVLRYG